NYTVRGRITDKDGGFNDYTDLVEVTSVAPTASFTNNGPVTAGDSVTFTFSSQYDPSSDDTSAGFKYSYHFNHDGTFDVSNSTSASASTSFASAGSYVVKGRIADKDGAFTDYTTTVTVNAPSQAPTANAGSDQSSKEGSSVNFQGSAT